MSLELVSSLEDNIQNFLQDRKVTWYPRPYIEDIRPGTIELKNPSLMSYITLLPTLEYSWIEIQSREDVCI